MDGLTRGIILKDRVLLSHFKTHEEMLKEHGVKNTRESEEELFVRVALLPIDGIFSDVKTWEYEVHQNIFPEWYVEESDKERFVSAVSQWASEHIIYGDPNLVISSGVYYVLDSTVTACGKSVVVAYGHSNVTAKDYSTVKALEYSTVKADDNSTVTAMHYSTVAAYDNSTVTAKDDSTVKAGDYSTVKACDNSTVTAIHNSTVVASGNSTVIIKVWASNKDKNIELNGNAVLVDHSCHSVYFGCR